LPTAFKNTPNNQAQHPEILCITAIRATKTGATITNTWPNMTDTSTIGPILDKGGLKNALFTG